ncbi:hypothetical protein BDV33DRAFT_186273 [Aspergillus novoparasiticus]|uniref:Uncharacterized protein n=1 Tax=Aspergillus novoparasiticus TaxID=986946 RepID=A0A5N6E6G3_9EURO|nr:hypothetical protein BDV33DRAFT_186273 [Aspergillus novoparasiticus]
MLNRLGFMLDFNHRNIIRIQSPNLLSSPSRSFPRIGPSSYRNTIFSSACPQTLEVRYSIQ